jgi:hypothetical protein
MAASLSYAGVETVKTWFIYFKQIYINYKKPITQNIKSQCQPSQIYNLSINELYI